MEIAKYLCEFFFDNFWHWFGLLLICSAIKIGPTISINNEKSNNNETTKKD